MTVRMMRGDVLTRLADMPDASVHCCVSSPPYYGLRDYQVAGQIGLEASPNAYIDRMVDVFREVRRVLRPDGTLWLNLGDSYCAPGGGFSPNAPSNLAGSKQDKTHPHAIKSIRSHIKYGLKPKDLMMMPARVALALQADGWYLRSEIIWHKPNPMPESCRDRCTSAHEKIFMLSPSERYFYDAEAIRECLSDSRFYPDWQQRKEKGAGSGNRERGRWKTERAGAGVGANPSGRNRRNVWTVASKPFKGWTETVRQIPVEPDAPVDGKKRKASPDCPVHGDHPGRATKVSYGGRVDGFPIRSERSGDPGLAQPADFSPIAPPPVPESALQNSDSLGPACSPSAISHNSGSRKKGHAPATIPTYTPCAETLSRTGGTSAKPASSGIDHGKPESNSAAPESSGNRSNQTYSGIADRALAQGSFSASRAPRCTCEWYVEIIEKTSHFATFPPALIEPCILAGTSAHGVCACCGAPWGRLTARKATVPRSASIYDAGRPDGMTLRGSDFVEGHRRTVGWQPSCACGAAIVPATILDPFAGAGTVGLVADRLGRHAVLIEINSDYTRMSAIRIQDDAGLFADVTYS